MARETIGVGIITHNRRDIFNATYRRLRATLPRGAELVVIDDHSDIPTPYATEYLPANVGIAAATNRALHHLRRHDHIFVFNDDVHPVTARWWRPYVQSGYNHLALSFEHKADGTQFALDVRVIKREPGVWWYESSNGLMMYMRRVCLDQVGGMDPAFGLWGNEHRNYSMRIHRAGLTPHPFMDVPNAIDMFYAHDRYGTAESSVPESVRVAHMRVNGDLYDRLADTAYKIDIE